VYIGYDPEESLASERKGRESHITYLTVDHGIFQVTTVGSGSSLIAVHICGVRVCGADGNQRLRFKCRRGVLGHFVEERGTNGIGIGTEVGVGWR
jgi:hypothetical protein